MPCYAMRIRVYISGYDCFRLLVLPICRFNDKIKQTVRKTTTTTAPHCSRTTVQLFSLHCKNLISSIPKTNNLCTWIFFFFLHRKHMYIETSQVENSPASTQCICCICFVNVLTCCKNVCNTTVVFLSEMKMRIMCAMKKKRTNSTGILPLRVFL